MKKKLKCANVRARAPTNKFIQLLAITTNIFYLDLFIKKKVFKNKHLRTTIRSPYQDLVNKFSASRNRLAWQIAHMRVFRCVVVNVYKQIIQQVLDRDVVVFAIHLFDLFLWFLYLFVCCFFRMLNKNVCCVLCGWERVLCVSTSIAGPRYLRLNEHSGYEANLHKNKPKTKVSQAQPILICTKYTLSTFISFIIHGYLLLFSSAFKHWMDSICFQCARSNSIFGSVFK